MARMIPSVYVCTDPKSREGEMYNALSKLPQEYYVFHSYRIRQFIEVGIDDSESDFVIFHPDFGCLFIEAKNGHVIRKENGDWEYSSGLPMKDPFDQACGAMYAALNKFRDDKQGTIYEKLLNNCKFLYAVWFPAYTQDEINKSDFGPNVIKKLILTKEALTDPTPYVESIMREMQKIHCVVKHVEIIEDSKNYKHKLSKDESMEFFKHVLCPSFDIVDGIKKKFMEDNYARLLSEQCIVLDFLAKQKSAAISGASGTGKTVVALERAKRLSQKGDKVLFLCYNNNLKTFLETNNREYSNIDFYTIDGYACKETRLSEANYNSLRKILEEKIANDLFEYKHIIVDEGQDFGRDDLNEAGILDLFADYGNNFDGASFFIFYDKNQLVNSKQLPSYLQNVDSKLTLYKNCRNTRSIATTAYSLMESKPEMNDKAVKGDKTLFVFYSNKDELEKRIDNLLKKSTSEKDFGSVLLTCKGINSNSLKDSYNKNTGKYESLSGIKVPMYSCATFKGLEEDYVFLYDVDEECFKKDNFAFYVGASRARKQLYVFVNLNEESIVKILQERFPNCFKQKNKYTQLALAMGGEYSK